MSPEELARWQASLDDALDLVEELRFGIRHQSAGYRARGIASARRIADRLSVAFETPAELERVA